MLVGCIAIAGIPPLAGFFSKDEILWSAYRVGGYGQYVWGVGAVAAALTAFYMFRLYWMTFGGSFRGTAEQAKHVHESPRTMIVPLQVLAVGSILAGFLGVPAVLGGGNFIEHFLEPVFEPAHHALGEVFTAPVPGHGTELALMGLSVLIAAGGILVATRFYRGAFEIPSRLAASFPGAYRTLLNKYWVDELYGRGLRPGPGARRRQRAPRERPLRGGRGRRRGAAGPRRQRPRLGRARRRGAASNLWDRFVVDGAVNAAAFVLDNLSYALRAVQNGLVQNYALSMLIGLFLLIAAGRFFLGLY